MINDLLQIQLIRRRPWMKLLIRGCLLSYCNNINRVNGQLGDSKLICLIKISLCCGGVKDMIALCAVSTVTFIHVMRFVHRYIL